MDNKNRTPIELVPPYSKDHTQILQLFHPFTESSKAYAVESYSKVFLCGDTTAGKSSLCELIKYRSDKSSDHEYDPSYQVTVTPLTAGIEVHTITSLEIGHIVMYDFAGHHEYYSSHNAVLENLMLRSPAVFVIVNKLTESDDVIEKNLYYWLSFIKNVIYQNRVRSLLLAVMLISYSTRMLLILSSSLNKLLSVVLEDKFLKGM